MYTPALGAPVPRMVSAYPYGSIIWGRVYDLGVPTTSLASPGTNAMVYLPIILPGPCTARRVWWANGTTASGNVSAAVYAPAADNGPGTKVVECGSTAQSGTSQVQFVDITDTPLTAGLWWISLATSSGSATFRGLSSPGAALNAYDLLVEASITVGTLPATATPAEAGSVGSVYLFGFATTASP